VVSLIDLTVPRTHSSAGAAQTAVEIPKMLAAMTSAKARHDVTPFALTEVFAWKVRRFPAGHRGSGQTYAIRMEGKPVGRWCHQNHTFR
jgi:hypothetical protein